MKEEKEAVEIRDIDIKDLVQIDNYRSNYNESNISDLMRSFKSEGMMQAIGVVKIGSSNKYEIIYGNRRYLAAKKLGWDNIKASVYSKASAAEKILMNLNENLQREDILAFDEGRGYHLLKKNGLTLSEISVRIGKTVSRISNTMKCFEELPPEMRGRVVSIATHNRKPKEGKIPSDTASFLLDVKQEYNLSKSELVSLMDHAAQDGVTKSHIYAVAKTLAAGIPLDLALKKSGEIKEVSLKILIPRSKISFLEKKYNTQITNILLSYLMTNKELGVKTRKEILLRSKNNKFLERTL